jgi:transcriptional regulator with XRE-family HTH domain
MTGPEPLPSKHSKACADTDICIGARLRFWRKTLNINSKQLAKKLQVTYQQLQKYEKGANRISASRLYQVALELHIPVSYFYQDVDLIVQTAPGTGTKDVLNTRMSAIEFMTTNVAMELCRAFSGIKNPYTKEAVLNLVSAIAERDRLAAAPPPAISKPATYPSTD